MTGVGATWGPILEKRSNGIGKVVPTGHRRLPGTSTRHHLTQLARGASRSPRRLGFCH
jgi:hypothetical protein